MTISDRIRVKDVRLFSDNHYVLKSSTFESGARQRRMADAEPRDL